MRKAAGKKTKNNASGQMTVEYSVMFVTIVAVVIFAAANFIRPALNRFFNSTARVINATTTEIENRF